MFVFTTEKERRTSRTVAAATMMACSAVFDPGCRDWSGRAGTAGCRQAPRLPVASLPPFKSARPVTTLPAETAVTVAVPRVVLDRHRPTFSGRYPVPPAAGLSALMPVAFLQPISIAFVRWR